MSNYYVISNKEDSDICLSECHEAHQKKYPNPNTKIWGEELTIIRDGKTLYLVKVCIQYANPHRFPMETSPIELSNEEK